MKDPTDRKKPGSPRKFPSLPKKPRGGDKWPDTGCGGKKPSGNGHVKQF